LTILQLLAIAGIGVFAGTVNTIAGGGSLITLPALIFMGMPAVTANATNRVGVFTQSLAATERYRRQGIVDLRRGLVLLVPSCIGAVLGSLLSIDIDELLFRRVIAAVMLLMLVIMMVRPKRWLEGRGEGEPRHLAWRALAFFFIGVYGGFLQAGVGVILLVGLVLLEGQDLLRANGVKVLLVAGFTLLPVAVYACNGLIAWDAGLALAAGSAVGGLLGARMTVSWGPRFIRGVLVAVVLVSAGKLFGLF